MIICKIEEMAEGIENQINYWWKIHHFIQFNLMSLTHKSKESFLLCFEGNEWRRVTWWRTTLFVEFAECAEIIAVLNTYILEYGIEWKKHICICTYGATNMTRHLSWIVAKVKNVGHPDFLSTHCIINSEKLKGEKNVYMKY